MVRDTRDVRSAPSDHFQVPQAKVDHLIHQLPMGCRHRRDEIVRQGQPRIRILHTSHRRFFEIRAYASALFQGQETASAQKTFFRTGRKPAKLRTDKGTEYRNRGVQRLLKREKVDHFFTQNEQKSSYAERAIKTIKSKFSHCMSRHQTHRWIDVLDSVTQSYNGSYHRSIKMTPRGVTKRHEARLW